MGWVQYSSIKLGLSIHLCIEYSQNHYKSAEAVNMDFFLVLFIADSLSVKWKIINYKKHILRKLASFIGQNFLFEVHH